MMENQEAVDLAAEFPRLWSLAEQYDFAERLGGCSDPLLREIDKAMRELWDARRAVRLNREGAVT